VFYLFIYLFIYYLFSGCIHLFVLCISMYSVGLSADEESYLSHHEYCLDYRLSKEEAEFMDEHGYLVLRKFISEEECDKVLKEASMRSTSILGISEQHPDTWKKIPAHGCIDLWNLQSLYELRQHPKIYSVFAQLLKTHRLLASVDRVSMKPPPDVPKPYLQPQLHTDLNYWYTPPDKAGYQGGLCLHDCPMGGGGFWCIPGFHKPEVIERYKKECEKRMRPPGPKRVFVIFEDLEFATKNMIEIPLQKGDYVIWSSNLPHNGGINTIPGHWRKHAFFRCVALDGPCVTQGDASWFNGVYKSAVREAMTTGKRPSHYASINPVKTGGRDDKETVDYHVPTLSWLGERVLGVRPWDEAHSSSSSLPLVSGCSPSSTSPSLDPSTPSSSSSSSGKQSKYGSKKPRLQNGWNAM